MPFRWQTCCRLCATRKYRHDCVGTNWKRINQKHTTVWCFQSLNKKQLGEFIMYCGHCSMLWPHSTIIIWVWSEFRAFEILQENQLWEWCLSFLYIFESRNVRSRCKKWRGKMAHYHLIIEIFCPETLFGKNIAIYHFLWYSSLVSLGTPFFYSSVAPDMASRI